MKKTINLYFANAHSVDMELLRTISVELQSFCYLSKRPEGDIGSMIYYYPQKGISFYTNSFMPVISVEAAPTASGVNLCIVGQLSKVVRLCICISFVLIWLMQFVFIQAWRNGHWENPVLAFLPAILFLLFLTLVYWMMSLGTKAFAEKYRRKVKELL